MPHPSSPLAALWAQGFDLELAILTAALILLGAAGYWLVMQIRRWSKEEESDAPSTQDQLAQYRAMVEDGLLEGDEFEKLRQRLGERSAAQAPRDEKAP